jgi:hypothetical protein
MVSASGAEPSDMNKVIARWQDWSGKGIEHLVLREGSDEIVADSAILGMIDDDAFAVRYRILCDTSWRVRKVKIAEIGSDITTELVSDGVGNWVDGSATELSFLGGAIDIDISVTPFTNTLPIRRLGLRRGQSNELLVVYVQLPGLRITTDRQRYTCLVAGKYYRYESVDSNLKRDIEVDDNGLVVTYPGLFRRAL